MTAERDLLVETLDQLLTAHCDAHVVDTAETTWAPPLWRLLHEAGLTSVGLPVEAGAVGGDLEDAIAVARAMGRHAAPVPWPETAVLAGWLTLQAGLTWEDRTATVTPPDTADVRVDGGLLQGTATRVPWASSVDRLAVIARTDSGRPHVALVDPEHCHVQTSTNIAGEPRDTVMFHRLRPIGIAEVDPQIVEELQDRGALARTAQTVGAQERVLELTIGHARTREQFGRPIGSFQAVSQHMAILAGETAVSAAALQGALAAVDAGDGRLQVAMAKVRVAQAASVIGMIAHQVHGAIGTTKEHRLQHFTRRMWSWRDEFDTQGEWEVRIGERLAQRGPDELWPLLTS